MPVLLYVGVLVAIVGSLGAPLVPTVSEEYHISLATAQWSLTAALLVGAVSSPVIGRLGDTPRRRPALLILLGLMTLGGALGTIPGSFGIFMIARACQGFGLAQLPLVMSVARDHLPPVRARRAIANLSVTAAVGVGFGYPLIGLVELHLGFRTAFWFSAGAGAIAFIGCVLVVPASHVASRHERFNYLAAALLALGVGGVVLAISEGESWGWLSPAVLCVVIGALAVLALWVRIDLRAVNPVVNLRLMRHPNVVTANVAGIVSGVALYMLVSMLTRFAQTPTSISYGLGASIVLTGLLLLPQSLTSFVGAQLLIVAIRRVPVTRVLAASALTVMAGLAVFAGLRNSVFELLIVTAVAGVGIGGLVAALPRMIVETVPPSETSSALAMSQVVRNIGYVIGSAMTAAVLGAFTHRGSHFPADRGYTAGALIAMGFCLVTAVVSLQPTLARTRQKQPAQATAAAP